MRNGSDTQYWYPICERDLSRPTPREFFLQEMEAAHQRLVEGTYGICEKCGGEIDSRRLAALPLTPLCIRCKREEEEEEGGRR